jgi:hypothetical protein
MLEAEYLTTLRIDARHHMLDRSVFSCRVHPLKNEQNGIPIGCIKKLSQRTQMSDVLIQELLVLIFRFVHGIDLRRPLFEIDLVSFPHTKLF